MKRAVFLDRDGVLNEAVVREGRPYPPASIAELKVVPDAPQALERLRAAGFLLIVVTNQPDVARGVQARETVEAMNGTLQSLLPLDDVLVCFHDGQEQCDCRKPKPGLLIQASQRHEIDRAQSFMIGDRWRDVDAGYAAGCRTVLIDYAYQERPPDHPPDYRAGSLNDAVDWVLATSGGKEGM